MSIKIHHGPPGSYKTSGALADDLPKAVLAGRHIITNVRGLSDEENIREVMAGQGKKVPDSFKLTYIKTDPTDVDYAPDESCAENMEMLRRFWHWSPDGAFFILDEIQEIYPKTYKDKQLKALEFPGGINAANDAGRFLDIALAFEKHRHKNWDFILTTPNINKVHPIIRGSSEGAYKHKNLALLGGIFKGRYIEGFHSADTNGRPSDFYSITRKRVPDYVFKLYKSTATGVVQDTTAGQSLFSNPRILLLLGILAIVFAFVTFSERPAIFRDQNTQAPNNPSVGSSSLPVAPPPINLIKPVPVRPDNLGNSKGFPLPPLVSYIDKGLSYYSGGASLNPDLVKLIVQMPDGSEVRIDKKTLIRNGMQLVDRGGCMAELHINGVLNRYLSCPPPIKTPQDNQPRQPQQQPQQQRQNQPVPAVAVR